LCTFGLLWWDSGATGLLRRRRNGYISLGRGNRRRLMDRCPAVLAELVFGA
jgi:hypothetical protein